MPSRKKNKGKARRAKAASAAARGPPASVGAVAPGVAAAVAASASAQQPPDALLGLAELSLNDNNHCDHGRSKIGDRCEALIRDYDSELKRIFDKGNMTNEPNRFVQMHVLTQLLGKEGFSMLSKDFTDTLSSGLLSLGIDYLVKGQTQLTYPYPWGRMATVVSLTLAMTSKDPAKVEIMYGWGERETTLFLAEKSGCSCLKAKYCNHGRTDDIFVNGPCHDYLFCFEEALSAEHARAGDLVDEFTTREAALKASNWAYGQVIGDGNPKGLKEKVMKCLLSLGTNLVLAGTPDSQMQAASVATALLMLDSTIGGELHLVQKVRPLMFGGPCEWARLFAGRMSCSCVVDRRAEMASRPGVVAAGQRATLAVAAGSFHCNATVRFDNLTGGGAPYNGMKGRVQSALNPDGRQEVFVLAIGKSVAVKPAKLVELFEMGDRVIVQDSQSNFNGQAGTIAVANHDYGGMYSVRGLGSCAGAIPGTSLQAMRDAEGKTITDNGALRDQLRLRMSNQPGASSSEFAMAHLVLGDECKHGYPRANLSEDNNGCVTWMKAFEASMKDFIVNDCRPAEPGSGMKD